MQMRNTNFISTLLVAHLHFRQRTMPIRKMQKSYQANTKVQCKLNKTALRTDRRAADNSVLPQLAVPCKIEAECYYQTFVQVDSEVLRNRQLRQHAKRYWQVRKNGILRFNYNVEIEYFAANETGTLELNAKR